MLRRLRHILGLEIEESSMRLAQVRLLGGQPVLERAASVPLDPRADPAAAAATLLQMMRVNHFASVPVAICLPPGSGYLQSHDPDDQTQHHGLENTQEYLESSWDSPLPGRNLRVTGRAKRSEVLRAVDIARQAGLSVAHVELPQVAVAAVLGLLEASGPSAKAGYVVEVERITFVLAAANVPVMAQSLRRESTTAANALRKHMTDLETMVRMHRAAALEYPSLAPAGVGVISDSADNDLATPLSRQLGLPAQTLRPGESFGLSAAAGWPENASAYSGALGAAFIGLGLTPVRTDFLRSLSARPPGASGPWFPLALTLGVLLIAAELALGWWFLHGKRVALENLQQSHQNVRPQIERRRALEQDWRVMGRWLPSDHPGHRIASESILKALNGLFQESTQAYVTQLTLDNPDTLGPARITIKGQSVNSAVLYEFLGRLKDSGLFEKAEMGPVTENQPNAAYPRLYSLTLVLKAN